MDYCVYFSPVKPEFTSVEIKWIYSISLFMVCRIKHF